MHTTGDDHMIDKTKLYTYEEMLEFVRDHVGVNMDTDTNRNNYGGYSTTITAQAVLTVPGEAPIVLSEDCHSYSD